MQNPNDAAADSDDIRCSSVGDVEHGNPTTTTEQKHYWHTICPTAEHSVDACFFSFRYEIKRSEAISQLTQFS